MSYTIVQKIMAEHLVKEKGAGRLLKRSLDFSSMEPGTIIQCEVDITMVHEQLGGRIAPEYEKLGDLPLKYPDRIFFILDHWVPPPDVRAAKMHQRANEFAEKYGIKWRMGQNKGICHQVLPEMGFARPGMLIVGSDSHSTTYGAFNAFGTGIGATDAVSALATGRIWMKVPHSRRINFKGKLGPKSMGKDVVLHMLGIYHTNGAIYDVFEFGGNGLCNLSIAARMTIANMTVEMGAKAGIFEYDTVLKRWLSKHKAASVDVISEMSRTVYPDADASYKEVVEIDLNEIPPMVAKPYSPDNVIPVEELGDIEIDEGFLGSCTNGRLEDLRIAAKILKGNRVKEGIKFIVIPASREVYLQAMREGLLEIFVEAGAMVEYPSCGPCIGGHLGVLGPGEVAVSSSNRNFKGRMGDPSSKTYLASPAVVAASVIEGKITIPKVPIWPLSAKSN